MNTPRHTRGDTDPIIGLSSAPLTRSVSAARRCVEVAITPAVYLGTIAQIATQISLDKAGARWHAWREHRAEWAAHRRAGGEYPGIDRPHTWAERRAWARQVREQG